MVNAEIGKGKAGDEEKWLEPNDGWKALDGGWDFVIEILLLLIAWWAGDARVLRAEYEGTVFEIGEEELPDAQAQAAAE